MIIQIKSNNPHLLDILNKNPNTDEGLYLKPCVNGILIGNCVSANQYDVIFQDSKYSFAGENNTNQLDFKSYCDPKVVLKVLGEFFNHILNYPQSEKIKWLDKTYQELDTFPCEFYIENIWIESNYVKEGNFFLDRYFNGFEVRPKGVNLYSLKYTGKNILDTFGVIAIVLFLTQMVEWNSLFLNDDLLKKYIKILSNIKETPYFIYYLLAKKLGTRFEALIPELESAFEKNNNIKCKFTPYSNYEDRIEYIRENLDFNNTILDYGCAEMTYFKVFARHIKTPFYSYDVEDYSELHNKIKDRYKDKEWYFTTDLSTISSDVPLSVICSEVIEHNDIGMALFLMNELLLKKNVKQLIITTPNVKFNEYYGIEMRHEDHVQELDTKEFKNFIKKLGGKAKFFTIGDKIGKEATTLGAIINYE